MPEIYTVNFIQYVAEVASEDIEADSPLEAAEKGEQMLTDGDIDSWVDGYETKDSAVTSVTLGPDTLWEPKLEPEPAQVNGATEALREALENVTASAENMLLHHGKAMSEADRAGRRKVIAAAKALLDAPPKPAHALHEDDPPHRFQMTYEHCGQSWIETWSSACNDKCPVCNKEIEPSEIEDIRSYATDGESDGV